MFGLGMGELVILLVFVVLVFGAKNIPALGKSLGQGIKNFKTGLKEDDSESNKIGPQ